MLVSREVNTAELVKLTSMNVRDWSNWCIYKLRKLKHWRMKSCFCLAKAAIFCPLPSHRFLRTVPKEADPQPPTHRLIPTSHIPSISACIEPMICIRPSFPPVHCWKCHHLNAACNQYVLLTLIPQSAETFGTIQFHQWIHSFLVTAIFTEQPLISHALGSSTVKYLASR